ncbi:hypothetical protein AAFF_G00262020 [Aldrovandia affinis]|uniref:Telomerase reverse transcriptase n=1 Tax=Aldrovandia affinis TaxID=143900 RepID=A0AAD7SSF7_9TELE|nr:hypothetical protein AAFF_G00262020 [Aldrovandia affinis]
MAECDLSRALCILRSVYPVVQTIDEFSQSILFRDGTKAVLIEPSDNDFFKTSARRIIVCAHKLLPQGVASSNQMTTLLELLALVLNSAKKGKSNVLSQGYVLSEYQHREVGKLSLQGELTQSAFFISGSDVWKTINRRLGTEVTRYLLESCAVFVAAPPSCLFQVCGVPFYSCVTVETCSVFQLSRPRSPRLPTPCAHRASNAKLKPKRDICHSRQGRSSGACERRRWGKKRAPGKCKRPDRNEDGEEECEPAEVGPMPKRMKNEEMVNAQRGERAWKTASYRLEGGPSWLDPLPPSQTFIHTRVLMYGGRGLKSFVLNRKLRGEAGAWVRLQGRDLVRLVFFERTSRPNSVEKTPKKLPKRLFSMVGVFSQLLLQHRKCPYARLLHKACPAVGYAEDLSSLLALHCSPFSIYRFVRECLHRVVPKELWGSAHNRVRFLSRIKAFLSMGRFDRLSVSELLWKVRVNDCDWLKISKTGRVDASEHRYRECLLGQFLAWLLQGYVLGLVRAVFYVTESMGQKNTLRFYRGEVWAKLQELGFSKLLSKGQWKPLTPEQVATLPKTVVVSHLRCIPKQDSLRPIIRNVKMDVQARSFQSRLKDLHDVLRVCVQDRPSLLGSTVFGLQDIHRVLGPFAAGQKGNPRSLYFVKMDVSGAYDSLPHDKLLQVVSEVLSPVLDEVFSVRRFAQVWADSRKGVRKAFRRQASTLADTEMSMNGFVMALQREGKLHSSIMVEQHFSSHVCGRDVLEFFKEVLSNYVIRFGMKMFRQCRGVPQGSVPSTLLCCLCYGHMENTLLNHVVEGGGCLMRLVDDFLLITPDLGKAQTFLKTLQGGVAEYGCFINPQKVAVNFPLPDDCPDVQVLPSGSLFPWCGLLVDPSTLDVYTDYSGYTGLSLRCSMTLGSSPHAGLEMKRKLLSILGLKCHALFLDLKINSPEAVCQNIYKIVLFQAYRFHACAQNLPFGQKVKKNTSFFLLLIWKMAKCTSLHIKRNNRGVPLPVGLCYKAVELMYCVAFLCMMSRHRCLYKCLLSHIRMRKGHLERRLGDLKVALIRRSFTPVIPDDFKLIRM